MKGLGIALIVLGVIGVLLSGMMFGDIGVAAFIGSLTAILSGVGFVMVNKRLSE